MVLWLEFHAPHTGGMGLIPGWGTGSHRLEIVHATMKRSRMPQLRPAAEKYTYKKSENKSVGKDMVHLEPF